MAKAKLGDVQLDESGQDWRVWLTGKSPKRDTEVTGGYWRVESGKGYATPVYSYFDEGRIIVEFPVGAPFLPDKPMDIDTDCGDVWLKFAADFWPKCKPVSGEDFAAAVGERTKLNLWENGKGFWADGLAVQPRDTLGANHPPEEAADLMLKGARENLAKAKKLVESGAAKTQTAADGAANLEKAMSEQRAALGEFHQKEKAPHLEAGRAVDDRFLPLVKEMVAIGKELHSKVKAPFLKEQERIAAEAQAAAQAAAQKVIEEAAAKAAAEAPKTPMDEGWDESAPQPTSAPAVEVNFGRATAGARGARRGLKDVKYGLVEDPKAMVNAMVENLRFHPELKTLLEAYATRLARTAAGDGKAHGDIIYPGVKLDIRRE